MPSVRFLEGQAGGTAEYRCRVPGRALRRLGWDVDFAEHLDVTVDGRVRDDPDLLVVSRMHGDYLPDAFRRVVANGRTRVVYDIDDWFRGLPDYNPATRLGPTALAQMHECMRFADLITCSTPELAEGYADLGPTVVLPNCLDPDLWGDALKYRAPRTKIHIGWMGAFHWRAGDLELLRWVPDFLDRHPDFRFVALGCRELLDHLGVEGLTTQPAGRGPLSRNLHPYERLPAMLGHLDVSLVPLAYSRFNQAKSHCKGMESNASGATVVASPSREYRTYIEPGVNGFLVRGAEWERTVLRAVEAHDPRRCHDHARRWFIDRHIHRWVDAYEGVRSADHHVLHA